MLRYAACMYIRNIAYVKCVQSETSMFRKLLLAYIITRTEKHLKKNKEIGMMLPKKELIQVE